MALDAELEAVQRELEELGCDVDDDELAELDSADLAELQDLDDAEIAGLEEQLREAQEARESDEEEDDDDRNVGEVAASAEDADKEAHLRAVQAAFEAEMADLDDRFEGGALVRELKERLSEKVLENDELVGIVDYIKQKYFALKEAGGGGGGGGGASAAQEAEMEDLRDALDDQEQENINLDRILQQLQAAHLELKRQYGQLQESSASAEAAHQHQLQEMERSIIQCTERFLGMKKDLDETQQKLDLENRTVCEELALSKKKNEEIEFEVERLLEEKAALEEELQRAEGRVGAAKDSETSTRDHLHQGIAKLEQQLKKRSEVEQSQKSLINQLESDVATLQKKNTALQASCDEAERLARKQEREISRLNSQMQRLEEEKARLHKEKREAERQARLR